MAITVAETAGFCFGVKRALETSYNLIEKKNKKLYSLGHLIHNKIVTLDLEQKGITPIEDIDEISDPENSCVIIRAHGVGKDIYTQLKEKNIEYIDLACPFVKKIHKIVAQKYKEGFKIIVVGKKEHPEVIGINGWCENTAFVTYEEKFDTTEIEKYDKICVVGQTTINKEKFYKIIKFLKNYCKSILIFDTMCNATLDRQEEAKKIAACSDVFIVIGDEDSSNTKELYEISRNFCKQTFLIGDKKELPPIDKDLRIGVTAGASTPWHIVKEVLDIMNEENTFDKKEESFEELFEQYSNLKIFSGQILTGIVDSVSPTEAHLNFEGCKLIGILPLEQITEDSSVKIHDVIKVGDQVDVSILKYSDSEGTMLVSKKKLDYYSDIKKIKSAAETKEIVEGRVTDLVNGGLIVLVGNFRVFVPASLASYRYTEDLSFYKGTNVRLRIISFDDNTNRAVGSIKNVLIEERKVQEDEIWDNIVVNKTYSAVVKSITNFGAFVDLGGVDGLVHISELSWARIKHPSEVVKVGDVLEVYVKDIDKENKKISLGFKKMEDNPWTKAKETLNVDDVVLCKVMRIEPYGAFAQIIPNVNGLIHISEISDTRVNKISEYLKVGQEVEAKIVSIDWEKNKINLSMKALIVKEDTQDEAVDEIKEDVVVETKEEPTVETSENITEDLAQETKDETAPEDNTGNDEDIND